MQCASAAFELSWCSCLRRACSDPRKGVDQELCLRKSIGYDDRLGTMCFCSVAAYWPPVCGIDAQLCTWRTKIVCELLHAEMFDAAAIAVWSQPKHYDIIPLDLAILQNKDEINRPIFPRRCSGCVLELIICAGATQHLG